MKNNYFTSDFTIFPGGKKLKINSLLFVILFLLSLTTGFAQSQGPLNTSNGATLGGAGNAWANPTRIQTNDNNYATSQMDPGENTELMRGNTYNFTIPGTATITGIVVTVKRRSDSNGGGNSINDLTVRLVKAGNPIGTNMATGAAWPTTAANATYGGTTNLWGTTWTPAEINAANFGVVFAAETQAVSSSRTASVDFIQVQVYYTNGPTLTSFTATSACAGTTPTITINGTGFATPASVSFNGTASPTVTVVSANQITAVLPAAATTGLISVTVPSGTITSSAATPTNFTVYPYPTVNAITGPTAVCVGSTITLSSTTPGGTWSSGTPARATVNGAGVVSGVSGGTSVITYSVTTNGCTSSVTSTITVNPRPVVSGEGTVCTGSTRQLSPMTGGTWVSNNPSIATINNSGLISALSAGTATFTFTDSATNCSTTSATVTVFAAPAITGQPAVSQSVCSGTSVSFTVTATGSGLNYQWYNGATLLVNGGNISGANSATLTLNPAQASDTSADYHCSVNGTCSPGVGSNMAALTVTEAVAITSQPVTSQSLCTGTAASFSVIATGAGLSYQWYNGATMLTDGGSISGATTSTLTINPLVSGNASANYHCVVSGTSPCTPVTSNNSALIVNDGPAISGQPAITQTICAGNSVSFSVTATGGSLVYQWYNGATLLSNGGNISGATSATLTINPAVPADSSTDYHCVISNGCVTAVTTISAELIVNERPFIPTQSATICSEGTFNVTPINGSPTPATIVPASTVYSWSAPSVTGGITGGTAQSGQTSISDTLINPTNSAQTATYTVTPVSGTAGTCAGTPFTVVVTVNPLPFIINSTTPVCSGTTLTITPSNGSGNIVPAGTTYSWSLPVTSGGLTGATTGSAQSSFIQTLTNTTGTMQTATYTLTATSGTCIGSTFNIVVNVNPKPTVAGDIATQTICSGTAMAPVTLSNPNAISGTVSYSWTRNNTANLTGIAASGTGNTISGTLTNTTNTPQTAVFTLTATSDQSCASDVVTVNVIVNPRPTVAATPATQTVCSGAAITNIAISNPNNVSGTTYSWTRDNTANLTGISASGTGNSITGSLTNTTNVPQTTIFTITASADGCPSSTTTATVIVNPQPTVSAGPATQTLCGSIPFGTITISNPNAVSGTTFSWVRNNTINLTGLANSGNGATISGTLVNNTNTTQTTTFTITATAAGCASATTTVDIVVLPAPLVTSTPASQFVCDGATGSITFGNSNNVSGTTYSWTRTNTTGITGIPASGTTTSVSGTLTNTTTTTQVTTFTVTATAPNGCSTTMTATITVYAPLVTPVIGESQTVCVFSTPAALTMTTPVSGGSGVYTYQWQRSTDGTTGWTTVGTGATYSPPFINNGNVNYYYRLVVTTSCSPFTLTSNSVLIQVVDNVGFSFDVNGANNTVCSGSTITPDISSIHSDDAAVRYTWTANPAYITPATGGPIGTTSNRFWFLVWLRTSSANFSFTAQNTTNASVTTQIAITPSVYDYPGPPSGAFQCSITPQYVNVTIRPVPVATASAANTTICSGSGAGISVTSSVTDAATTFNWTRNTPAGITGTTSGNTGAVAAGGTGSINPTLTNSTAGAINVTYTITPVSNGCSGASITIIITVAPAVTPGTVTANQTLCSGSDPAAFTQTVAATGLNLTYQWQSSTTSATGPWTNIPSATGLTYDPPAGLTQTTWYIRVVTSTLNSAICSAANTTPIVVTINNINPGSISGDQTICSGGDPAAFTSVAATGNATPTYQWQFNTTGCSGTWSNVPGATAAVYNIPAGLLVTTYYRRMATSTVSGNSCSDYSNCLTVYVNNVTAGTVGTDQTICGSSPSALTEITPATGSGTLSYQWQSSTTSCSGPWTNVGTGVTYTPGAISGVVYYHRITTSTLNGVQCTAISNCVTITVNSVTGGTISGNRTVCSGGDPAGFTIGAPATGTGLTYQWQSSTTSGSGPWTNIPGALAATYDAPGPITQTTYYQRIVSATVNSVTCTATSNFVTVFVNDVTAPLMAGDQNVCGGNDPVAFTVSTPATVAGTISYQWQSSTSGCGGPWTNIPSSNTPTYDPPVVSQTTYYHVIVTSTLNGVNCTAESNCLVVTFNGKTWNGSAGTNWATAANWTPSGVPTAAHCIIIPNVTNDPIISGTNYNAYGLSLTILNGGRLDVQSANNITITNFVNVNAGGTFNIADDASLVQIDNVSNTGIISMERITPPVYRFDYTYWNSPMTLASGYTLGNLSPITQYDKYYSWNPSISGGNGGWIQESVATIMNPDRGYIVRAPNSHSLNPAITQPYTATFTGTPNNGTVNIPIKIGSLGVGTMNDKLNLIGNPYPSAVSANAFLNDANNAALMDGTIYFWTHHSPPSAAYPSPFYGTFSINYTASDYASYNALGGTNTVPSGYGGPAPNGFIAAGQGFFVVGKATGTAHFENSMRVSGNNNVFFRNTNPFTANVSEPERHRVWLNFANTNGGFSQILVGYADGATNGLDRNFDGETNSGNTVSFYSLNSERLLTIQGRQLPFEVNDKVDLGYNATAANTYTIGIDHLDGLFENQNIYLEDKLLNTIHDIKESAYSFTSAAGTFDNRFVLRYTNDALGVTLPDGVTAVVFIKDGKLLAQANEIIENIQVFDISGKLIKTYEPATANLSFEDYFQYSEGIYIAKVKLSGGTIATVKLVNKN